MRALELIWAFRKTIIVFLAPILLAPLPIINPTTEMRCAYAVLLMAVYWMTEALPISVTALLPIVLFPLLGVAGSKDICVNYLKDTNFLFFGGLVVALAVEKWNLHKRIALRVLMLVGSQPKWLMCGFMSTTAFISMWLSNTATTAMMVPIAEAVLGELEEQKTDDDVESRHVSTAVDVVDNGYIEHNGHNNHDHAAENGIVENGEIPCGPVKDTSVLTMEIQEPKRKSVSTPIKRSSLYRDNDKPAKGFQGMCKAICLSICYAANIGGFATLTGTGPNLIMKGQMDGLYGSSHGINFSSWFVYAFPTMFLCLILSWIWLQILFLGPRSVFTLGCGSSSAGENAVYRVIRMEYEKLGTMSFAEGAVLVHFILLAVLWFTREPAFMPGWSNLFKDGYVTDACVGMTISVSLFICPSRLPNCFCWRRADSGVLEPAPALLDWESMKNMAWGVILVLGGGFALADACKISGLSQLIGEAFVSMNVFTPAVLVIILCLITSFFTEITSNVATATIFIPIMAELASSSGIHPLYLVMPVTICTSVAFMLPVATPPNAIVFAYNRLKIADMVKAGFVLKLFCLLVLVLSINTWGYSLFNLGEFPDWAARGHLNGTVNSTVEVLITTMPTIINTTVSS